MDAPPVDNDTSACVQAVPLLGTDGGAVAAVLIKQRFVYDLRGRCARVGGAAIRLVDVPWDADRPGASSVRFPADICLAKPSTDVVVVGSGMARGRAPVTVLDVIVRAGPVQKALRVFGNRVWIAGGDGLTLSAPEPFDALPLRWELAYGGFDTSNPAKPLEEPRNPVGRGLARDTARLLNSIGPAIEDPRDPIVSAESRPAPAGVGALGRHWAPRRSYLGTMDERWHRERMPLLPSDFDPRHNQVATPELITPAPLEGGELIELHGLSEEGSFRFELPRLSFSVGGFGRAPSEQRAALDTLLLEPNDRAFEMTFRHVVPLPRGGAGRALSVREKAAA